MTAPHSHLLEGTPRLHYLEWNPHGARTIVLLHGNSANGWWWDRVARAMAPDYRLLALDQRGHGDSEWSPVVDYRVAAHVSDIEGLIEATKLDRPIVVGQSMGGINAIAYATRHSDRMRAMVIVDVAPEISGGPGADRIREFSSTPELDSPQAFLERAVKFNPIRDPAVLRRSLHYNLRQTPAGKWTLKHDQRRRTDDAMRSFAEDRTRLVADLPKIKCPTLVVRGALSDVLTDADAEKFARSLPDGRWVRVEKSGHNVQGDNPRALLDAMLAFFSEAGIS